MNELKSCPFCGGVAQVNTWTMHGITESRCFCSNSDCPNSVRTVALEQWNTRPIEDELRARIAELEYQLEDWTNNGWAEDYKARIAELEQDLSNKETEYTDLWDDALALQSRIAESESTIEWLIEAGKRLLDSLCTDPEEEKTVEVMNWKAVVDKVNKERER